MRKQNILNWKMSAVKYFFLSPVIHLAVKRKLSIGSNRIDKMIRWTYGSKIVQNNRWLSYLKRQYVVCDKTKVDWTEALWEVKAWLEFSLTLTTSNPDWNRTKTRLYSVNRCETGIRDNKVTSEEKGENIVWKFETFNCEIIMFCTLCLSYTCGNFIIHTFTD